MDKWAYKRNNGVQPVGDDVRVDIKVIRARTIHLGVDAGTIGWGLGLMCAIESWRLHVEEEGLHYSELDAPDNNVGKVSDSVNHKQERYTNDEGQDLIDEWATKLTHAEFRVVMFAMIGKYNRRLGKKEPIHQETAKMQDYMQRWHEYEVIWAGE